MKRSSESNLCNGYLGNSPNKSSPKKESKVSLSPAKRKSTTIEMYGSAFLNNVAKNDLTVVSGFPGQGKSTQIPLMLHKGISHGERVIAIIHVNAEEMERVASFAKEVVSHKIIGILSRFKREVPESTKLKFMTDGSFLRELRDTNYALDKYSVIVLDDVHLRRWQMDLLMALLRVRIIDLKHEKKFAPKLVFISSGMNNDHLTKFYDAFCVNVMQLKQEATSEVSYQEVTEKPNGNVVGSAVGTVIKILRMHQDSNILCFLPGRDEVIEASILFASEARTRLPDRSDDQILRVQTLFKGMPNAAKKKISRPLPSNKQRIVFADESAEGTFPIPGINVVVDCGCIRVKFPAYPLSVCLNITEDISESQAVLRELCLKRRGSGLFFRLYKASDISCRFFKAEISQRCFSDAILYLISVGWTRYLEYPTRMPNYRVQYIHGRNYLRTLGAISKSSDGQLNLTPLGEKMARLPLSVSSARTVVAASELECLSEVLTIVAVLNAGPISNNEDRGNRDALIARRQFCTSLGDAVSLLHLFRGYKQSLEDEDGTWCRRYCVNPATMASAVNIRNSLRSACIDLKMKFSSCGSDYERINHAFVFGYISHLASYERKLCNGRISHTYRMSFTNDKVELPENSALYGSNPPKLVVHLGIRVTSKGTAEMNCACPISSSWAHEAYPNLVDAEGYARECAVIPSD